MTNEELLKVIEEAKVSGATELNLRGEGLKELSPEIGQLTNLTDLNLSGNQLTKLPSEICQLTDLARLSLSGNKLAALPPDIIRLIKLVKISLRGNQLTKLPPEIIQLPNLNDLDIRRNELTELPSQLFYLPKLETLELQDNPLSSPPLEIAERGLDAIRNYFVELEKSKQSLNEVKVLLVGDGAAGKTSLVKQLVGQAFNQQEDTTRGINIQDWEQDIGGQQIKINLWDFGGQVVQHATHQFFLSKRSLYILVLDSRKEERAEYWLRYIEAFGGGSPVLIVLNKQDENPSFDINPPFLLQKYPGIKAFCHISCKTGYGVAEFKKTLTEELAKVEMIGIQWPGSWFAVKHKLEQMSKPYISVEEYGSICKDAGIAEELGQETLVDFLHDLGVAVHFKDRNLNAMHVLDPVWVTNAVYKIITAQEIENSKGILYTEKLLGILRQKEGEKHSFPVHTHAFIIELMQKFELCYELGRDAVLIPQLLPAPEPEFTFNYDSSLRFALHYPDVLPSSVFPRLMVNVYKDIEDGLGWRTGVVLNDKQNGVRAVLKADTEARRINIWVQGERRRDYLHYLRYLLTYINSSFEKLTVSERVPMPDDPARTADYETLRKCAELDIERYMPEGATRAYNVHELLGLVQPKDAKELTIISEKIELESAEKLSLVDILIKVLKVNLFPPSITH